jgi:phage gpG-like protein
MEPVWEQINGGPFVVSGRVQTDALMAPALKQALQRSAILVQNDAKRGTPVDTGRLRASITHALDSRPVPLYATVGTNVAYGRWVHEGRPPGHMPPPAKLATWARRHGRMDPYALAMAIQKRGIMPRPFLTDALEVNVSNIRAEMSHAARMIEAAWRTQ